MKRPRFSRRQRRVLKWTGLTVCVLLTGVWVASIVWDFGRIDLRPGRRIMTARLFAGCLYVEVVTDPAWDVGRRGQQVTWINERRDRSRVPVFWLGSLRLPRRGLPYAGFWLPCWMPVALAAAPTGWLWWAARYDRDPSRCRRCGYDRSGLPAGVRCPECGTPVRAGRA